MKNLAKILCVVLFTAAPVFAKSPADNVAQQTDECSYDFANAKSALDAQSKVYSSVKKVSKNTKQKVLTQKAVFKKDKATVEFTTGGCAHYSYSFTFAKLGQSNFTSDQAFKKAIEMLQATATTVEGQALTKTLIENLEQAAMNKIFRPPNENYEIPCGDAQCSLDASNKGRLTVSYSFAL